MRITRRSAALGFAAMAACIPASLRAQAWGDPRVDSLVALAMARRVEVDTTLRAWTARADGTLEFLVELGNGAVLPPRVVKLEQLASQVRWERPGNTVQRIIGRRDTMFFPGDAGFYSDRYGVITNNLGDLIRLGDGKDVRDLPHPLSAAGRRGYEFALVDSLSLSLPGRRVELYELAVRPRLREGPGVVGSIHLDRATGDVVRMAVLFTRTAMLDARIERLTLLLENLLVEGQWWLPYRQEVDVVRAGSWFDFPTKGIVRGRWQLSEHAAVGTPGVPLPPLLPADGRVLVNLPGNRIALAPEKERALFEWPAPITSALGPGEQAVGSEDVASVQRQAEGLVETGALERLQRSSVGGRGISDFFHVNRVEGVAVGLGVRAHWSTRFSQGAHVAWGFSDEALKARFDFRYRITPRVTASMIFGREYRDAGDVAEVSGVRNTISAQAFADDNTNPYDLEGFSALSVDADVEPDLTLEAMLSWERQRPLEVNARPWSGTYGPTIPALPLDGWRLNFSLARRLGNGPAGTRVAWRLNPRLLWFEPRDSLERRATARMAGSLVVQVPAGNALVHLETHAGGVAGSSVPSQELVRLGGIVTGPGYAYHQFAGRVALSQRAELRLPVPFVSLPLLGYGRSPKRATLAPYGHLTCVGEREQVGSVQPAEGCFPSLGVAFSALFDLLRFDLAYGFRDGGWRFGVDAGRVVWGIL